MRIIRRSVDDDRGWLELNKIRKVVAAVLVGLSLGSMLPPDPVALPGLGVVPGIAASGFGLLVGVALYARTPDSSDCGCSGDCDC